MFLKCFSLLLFCNFIGAQYYHPSFERCPYPHLDNGAARVKQRMNFVKFSCRSRYTLMGNKYATCRSGHWDVPLPICIKSGCDPLEDVANAVVQSYHNNAWMLFFCLPGHNLVGSPVVYCDGRQWNATAPKCVSNIDSAPPKLSCDFEDPDLCGWKQDELHDFDWRRLNKRTPSSFLLTGPQYDHTYGKNGNGYYMYIESTSRLANDTARLLSPVFDAKLVDNGCFSFYYHMYGRSVGGLRVYQKPDKMNLYDVLHYSENGTNKYVLFEQWGNLGNYWFSSVSSLLDVGDDFQIVIEGIRGRSFMSDIAIDDVGILQGENCTSLKNEGSTPPSIYDDSCVGRCGLHASASSSTCDCSIMCVVYDNCCPDYLDVCEFGANNNPTDEIESSTITSTSIQLPQTQKLVATTTSTLPPTTSTTTSTTTTTTSTTTTTTKKPTTSTTKRTKPTFKPTSTKLTTATSISKSTRRPTVKVTTSKMNKTTTLAVMTPTSATASTTPTTKRFYYYNFTVKPPPPKQIVAKKSGSNAVITSVAVVMVALLCGVGAAFAWRLRGARGAWAAARLRARAAGDPEVRFLKADTDVDAEDE